MFTQTIANAWHYMRNGVRCQICGQYFVDGDVANFLVGPPKNAFVHRDCYTEHTHGRDEDEMRAWIAENKTPKATNGPVEDATRTKAIIDAIRGKWGYRVHEGPRVIRFYRGKRLVLSYDRRFDCMRMRIAEHSLLADLLLVDWQNRIIDHLAEQGITVNWER